MRTKENAVRYLVDHHDMRRQARMEAQKAARRAERKLLVEQALTAVVGFWVLTLASGILWG